MGEPIQLFCPSCGIALWARLDFGKQDWLYSHPWPSQCEEEGKPARKAPVRMLGRLTGTATSVSCGECGAGLVPEMVSREQGWRYSHKAGGCRWVGKKFKVVGVELEETK